MLLGTLQCTGHPRTQSPTSAQAEKRGWEHGPGGGPGPTCVTAAASPPLSGHLVGACSLIPQFKHDLRELPCRHLETGLLRHLHSSGFRNNGVGGRRTAPLEGVCSEGCQEWTGEGDTPRDGGLRTGIQGPPQLAHISALTVTRNK